MAVPVFAGFNKNMMGETRNVPLPADLCATVERKFAQVFPSLEDLLTFILRDLTSEQAVNADQSEERLVEERLRELGYL